MKAEIRVCEMCGSLFIRVLGKAHRMCGICDAKYLAKAKEESK